MASRANRRRARQAHLQARVQFGPQQRALVGLAGELSANYKASVRGARGTAAVTRATIKTVRPEIRRAYGRASAVRAGSSQDVASVLAGLGSSADPFRAAIAREQAGAKSRLAESQAGALAELSRRKVDASAGAQAQVRALAAGLRQDTNRIGQQIVGLAGDRGAFEASTIQTLRDADRKLGVDLKKAKLSARTSVQNSKRTARTSRRGQDLSHRDRVATRKQKTADAAVKNALGGAKAGVKQGGHRLTGPQQSHNADQLNVAVNTVKALNGKIPSHQLRQLLLTGYTTPRKNGKGGTKIPKITGTGGISGKDLVNAAYDIAVLGSLSRANRRALRGLRLPARWRRPSVGGAVGAAASALR